MLRRRRGSTALPESALGADGADEGVGVDLALDVRAVNGGVGDLGVGAGEDVAHTLDGGSRVGVRQLGAVVDELANDGFGFDHNSFGWVRRRSSAALPRWL